jgi:hypothetical protein
LYGASASVYNNKIFFCGGQYKSDDYNKILVYDAENLEKIALISVGKSKLNTAIAATSLYCFYKDSSAKLEIFDVVTLQKIKEVDLDFIRYEAAITSCGKYVFYGGGYTNSGYGWDINYLDSVDVYSGKTNEFVQTLHLSEARSELAATSCGNYVFFGGGHAEITSSTNKIYTGNGMYCVDGKYTTDPTFDLNGYSDAVDIFDATTLQFVKTLHLSEARSKLAATSCGNYIFFAGGHQPISFLSNGYSDTVDIFDVTTLQFVKTLHLKAPREIIAATSWGNYVYFAGGYGNSVASDIIDIFDITKDLE